jgi:STE24 endopeptidase
VYVITMIAWGAVAVGSLHPRVEDAMAWKVWRLRPPNALESQQIGPAWFGACAAAGVDPNRYRVWIHEGPEATAPATAGSTVAVTSWAALVLPRRNLEAVLAHELAHRLALPRPVSLIVHALSLPARVMAKAIRVGWRQPILGFGLKFFVGFLMVGVIGVWALWGFSFYIVLMLSPLVAPFVVRAANRASEKYADRIALDLGYGAALAEVFTGREYQRAQRWSAAPQQSLKDSQPLDSARLRDLERLLKSGPHNNRQGG